MNGKNDSWLERLTASGVHRDEALLELREVLLQRLHKTFHGRTGVDEALLEDVAQQALIKTLEKLDQFEGRSRFTTWATTIAIRIAFTELRRRHWKDVSLEQTLQDPAAEAAALDTGEEPSTIAGRQALIAQMYRIIENRLTDKQRTAMLAELRGMPLEEIGRRMGSNRNAIYKLTHDARRRLKQELELAGFSFSDLHAV